MTSGDIDDDGDLDIAVTIWGESDFVWYEKTGIEPVTWTKHTIDSEVGGVGIIITDMINNDTLDLVLAGGSANCVKWYKNEGGSPVEWSAFTIDDNLGGAEFVSVGDMDLDGDKDVVATGWSSNMLVWYENTGGTPLTWIKDTIDANLGSAVMCIAVDIDRDDTLDILANSKAGGDVVWYKNENKGGNWTKNVIDASLDGTSEVDTADIDQDGDPDVLATGTAANDVVWYENSGSNPVSWTRHVIDGNFTGAFALITADIDLNGTIDVIASGTSGDKVSWFYNDGGSPITWYEYPIDSNLDGAWEVRINDINEDNYPDVVVHQWLANGNIQWYKNPGTFSPPVFNELSQAMDFTVYPNPVKSKLHIETAINDLFTVEISSLSGQVLCTTSLQGSSRQMDLSFLKEGIYILRFRYTDRTSTLKLIKL